MRNQVTYILAAGVVSLVGAIERFTNHYLQRFTHMVWSSSNVSLERTFIKLSPCALASRAQLHRSNRKNSCISANHMQNVVGAFHFLSSVGSGCDGPAGTVVKWYSVAASGVAYNKTAGAHTPFVSVEVCGLWCFDRPFCYISSLLYTPRMPSAMCMRVN